MVRAASTLVQIVDVLGDDQQFAGRVPLQAGKRRV
jgi:hypothetical protein